MSKRINNIWFLARCIIRALFYGKANKLPKNISRIIVVPAGKLGDIVCATPVLVALRRYFPNAHIIVAGENYNLLKPLLADSDLVDEYYLNNVKADVALLTGPSFESTAPLYLAGIPMIVAPEVLGGISPQNTRPYMLLKKFIKTYSYHIGKYAPRERLRCLEPLGVVTDDTTKRLGFSESASKKVDQFFTTHGINFSSDFIVGITPTAGHKIKEWPEERFAKVADYLITKYHAKVIIVGGPKDGQKVNNVVSLMGSQKEVVITTDFNIDELKAFVSKLDMFISVDTGPIYIAEAFGIPTIDITGPIDENEQPPRGEMHRNVVPPKRSRPELYVLNAKSYDKAEALRQTLSITSEMVEKEIDILIVDLKKNESSH